MFMFDLCENYEEKDFHSLSPVKVKDILYLGMKKVPFFLNSADLHKFVCWLPRDYTTFWLS